jgi:hypothetical protein
VDRTRTDSWGTWASRLAAAVLVLSGFVASGALGHQVVKDAQGDDALTLVLSLGVLVTPLGVLIALRGTRVLPGFRVAAACASVLPLCALLRVAVVQECAGVRGDMCGFGGSLVSAFGAILFAGLAVLALLVGVAQRAARKRRARPL